MCSNTIKKALMFIILRVNICFSSTSLFYFDLSLERICMQKNPSPCHVIWKAVVVAWKKILVKLAIWSGQQKEERTMWDQLPNTPIECGIFYRFMSVSQMWWIFNYSLIYCHAASSFRYNKKMLLMMTLQWNLKWERGSSLQASRAKANNIATFFKYEVRFSY